MYKFNIEFGDISQDGHERTAVFSIECSVDQHELEKLFNNACINTNFDFKEELCDEYEVDSINIDYLYELKEEKNIDLLSIVEKNHAYKYDDYAFGLDPESFLKVFLEFTKMYGGKDFTYKISSRMNDRLSISMGYGLF